MKFKSCGAALAGGDPSDLIGVLASAHGDMAAIHCPNGTGESVVACQPIFTWTLYRAPDGTLASDLAATPEIASPMPRKITHDLPMAAALDQWQTLLNAVELVCDTPHLALPRWIGFIGYDVGKLLEPSTAGLGRLGHWPLMRWQLFRHYYGFNPALRRWTLCALHHKDDPGAAAALAAMQTLLQRTDHPLAPPPPSKASIVLAQPTLPRLARDIARVQEYIAAGDIYQANLAVPWSARTKDSPVTIYQRLCRYTAASHSAFLRFGDYHILCASPELFLRRQGRFLATQPIKGTRPRSPHDSKADQALRQELLESEKDQAELNMITDLLRNDLGKICACGSVRVENARELQAHLAVWHTSATITGLLRESEAEFGWAAICKALCPGGSITGAPKIRAMQIIAELENFPREVYCGNIGWINGSDGSLNIAIRTIFMHNNRATIYAGAGIVADSNPAEECQEILAKAKAPLAALGIEPT